LEVLAGAYFCQEEASGAALLLLLADYCMEEGFLGD